MYKAGAFDYKMSFLCILSFIFASMEDNSRKIKGLHFALTAVITNRSHGEGIMTTNNSRLLDGSPLFKECITHSDHVFTYYQLLHNYTVQTGFQYVFSKCLIITC